MGLEKLSSGEGGSEIYRQSDEPNSPSVDDIWIDVSYRQPELQVYEGGDWTVISSGSNLPPSQQLTSFGQYTYDVSEVKTVSNISIFVPGADYSGNNVSEGVNTSYLETDSHDDRSGGRSLQSNGETGRKISGRVDLSQLDELNIHLKDGEDGKSGSIRSSKSSGGTTWYAEADVVDTGDAGAGVRIEDSSGGRIIEVSGAGGPAIATWVDYYDYSGHNNYVYDKKHMAANGAFGSDPRYDYFSDSSGTTLSSIEPRPPQLNADNNYISIIFDEKWNINNPDNIVVEVFS